MRKGIWGRITKVARAIGKGIDFLASIITYEFQDFHYVPRQGISTVNFRI